MDERGVSPPNDGGRLPSRTALALALGILSFVLTLGIGMLLLYGGVGTGVGADDDGIPQTSFEFERENATVAGPDGNETREAIAVSYESGRDLPQENVIVTVNGERAWDVRTGENGSEAVVPWNDTEARLSGADARVVLYAEGLEATRLDATDEPSYLEPGDVVQVVWYSDDGERMTVLQRYVVEETQSEGDADVTRERVDAVGDQRIS